MKKERVNLGGVIFSIIAATMIFWVYSILDEKITKVMFGGAYFLIVGPVMVNYFFNVIIARIKYINYLQSKMNQAPADPPTPTQQKAVQPKKSVSKKESKVITYPPVKKINSAEYDNLRAIFRTILKSKKMGRKDILNFSEEIDKYLGKEESSKLNNYKCENDVHRIYIKMRSHVLTEESYSKLQRYLIETVDMEVKAE